MTILGMAASIRESPSLQHIRGFATKCRTIPKRRVIDPPEPGSHLRSNAHYKQHHCMRICMCSSKKMFNLQNSCPFLKQFILFRWVWYWWRLHNAPFCLLCNPMHRTCCTRHCAFLTARSSPRKRHYYPQVIANFMTMAAASASRRRWK